MGWLLILVAACLIFPINILALVIMLVLGGKVIFMFIEPPNTGIGTGSSNSNRSSR